MKQCFGCHHGDSKATSTFHKSAGSANVVSLSLGKFPVGRGILVSGGVGGQMPNSFSSRFNYGVFAVGNVNAENLVDYPVAQAIQIQWLDAGQYTAAINLLRTAVFADWLDGRDIRHQFPSLGKE